MRKFYHLELNYPKALALWVWHRCEIERTGRNLQEAIRILESTPHELFSNQFAHIPKALVLGLLYYEMSDMKSATPYFEESRKVLEEALKELPDDARIYSSLGLTYAGLGMKEDAVAAGEKALSIVNIAVDDLV